MATFDSRVREGLSEHQGARHGRIGKNVQNEGTVTARGPKQARVAGV